MSKVLSKDELNKNMNLLSKNWSTDGLYLKGSYCFNNFIDHIPHFVSYYNKLQK